MSRRKKYKLLLINPVNRRRKGLKRDSVMFHPPMALGIIAALTPGHWDVEILDEIFLGIESEVVYKPNLICHNLVFEMEKKYLDLESTFPQLVKKLDIND